MLPRPGRRLANGEADSLPASGNDGVTTTKIDLIHDFLEQSETAPDRLPRSIESFAAKHSLSLLRERCLETSRMNEGKKSRFSLRRMVRPPPTKDGFIHRSWMRNQGFPGDVFDGRPVIGICNNMVGSLTPCNAHLRQLAETA